MIRWNLACVLCTVYCVPSLPPHQFPHSKQNLVFWRSNQFYNLVGFYSVSRLLTCWTKTFEIPEHISYKDFRTESTSVWTVTPCRMWLCARKAWLTTSYTSCPQERGDSTSSSLSNTSTARPETPHPDTVRKMLSLWSELYKDTTKIIMVIALFLCQIPTTMSWRWTIFDVAEN